MQQLDIATKKASQSVKQLATKGDVKNAKVLAREVVRSNKQKDRLSVSKARLGSISTQLSQQLGRSSIYGLICRLIQSARCSYGESYWGLAEIDGDYETVKLAHQTAAD